MREAKKRKFSVIKKLQVMCFNDCINRILFCGTRGVKFPFLLAWMVLLTRLCLLGKVHWIMEAQDENSSVFSHLMQHSHCLLEMMA